MRVTWIALRSLILRLPGLRSPILYSPILCSLVVAGCAVGPRYERPEVAVPEKFPGSTSVSAQSAADPDLSQWWKRFGDAELESLVTRALKSNLDLQSAASRIRQARAQEVIAGSAQLPGVTATGAGVYMHSKSNPLGALGGGGDSSEGESSQGSNTTKIFAAGFDAAWELDLFGGVRRGIQAAQASAEGAEWKYRDAQVSLSAEVAIDYLALCATRVRAQIARDAIQRQSEALELLEARQRAGFITELDVNQQRAQLASTRAQLPALEAQARSLVHALGVLLAVDPESLASELAPAQKLPEIPAQLPAGLPSDLLRRRPDIRASERVLAAATAEVGVAVADLYPKFNLLGVLNYTGDSVNGLLDSRNLNKIGLGLIQWPILQGGRARAAVKISEEQRQQAYLAYQKSVLTAVSDTEDAIVRLDAEHARFDSLREAEAAAASSLGIARSQSSNGVVPYLNVLYADSTLLNVQNEQAQNQLALAQSAVSLFKALGGGYD